jgi:type IV pilus assembly protein PilC
MRTFNYEAKDSKSNKIIKATVQADSEQQAAKLLLAQHFTPISIKEVKEGDNPLAFLTDRITTKDRVIFTRQFSTLIAAGLPLAQSLNTLVDQTPNRGLRNTIQDLVVSVEGGRSLHDSFGRHPKVFDELFLSLVAAGEASGTLDAALQRIAMQQEKDAAIVGKIKGAMTYPIIVLVVIIGVITFMLLTVVPQVEKLYADLNKSLPAITEIIVSASRFLLNFWWLILIVVGVGLFLFLKYLQTPAGRSSSDLFKLNFPVVRGLYRKLYMARFTRVGQTLLDSGVSMLDMLVISGQAIGNGSLKSAIERATEKVRGGKDLSAALADEEYVPSLVTQMINIGEKSGKIDDMMGKTAEIYEKELDQEIASLSTAIEPVLMVTLALIAAGMVAAILLPIYGLVNNLPT